MSCTIRVISFNNRIISRIYPGIGTLSNSRRHYAKPAMSGEVWSARSTLTEGIAGLGKKKLGKAGPVLEKKVMPVETDPVKLVTYCCGLNIRKEGEEIKLKEDSEYPDWLWTLNTGPPISIDQLDPDTEEYWERVLSKSKQRKTQLLSVRRIK